MDELFFGMGRRRSPRRRRKRKSSRKKSGCSRSMSITKLRQIARGVGVDIYTKTSLGINRRTGLPKKRKLVQSCSTLKKRLNEAGHKYLYSTKHTRYSHAAAPLGPKEPFAGPAGPPAVFRADPPDNPRILPFGNYFGGLDLSFGRRHRRSPRKLHTGPQGGKYYLSKGRKVYVKSPRRRRSPRRHRRRSRFGLDSDYDSDY